MKYGDVVIGIGRYLRSVETAWSDECVVTVDDIVLLEDDMRSLRYF
jgi:hypothetical protein